MEQFGFKVCISVLSLTVLFTYVLFLVLVIKRKKTKYLDKYVRLMLLALGISTLASQGDLAGFLVDG